MFQDGSYLGAIDSYSGSGSSNENWNINQAPDIGPGQADNEGHMFFYEGSDGLSFNFLFNNGDNDDENGSARWDITVASSIDNPYVTVQDDSNEFYEDSSTDNLFYGAWTWSWGADGGAIAGLAGDWTITVDQIAYGWHSTYNNPLTSLSVFDNSGSNISLDLTHDIVFTPVPAPATMLLFGTGIAGLAWTRLRRKKNSSQHGRSIFLLPYSSI